MGKNPRHATRIVQRDRSPLLAALAGTREFLTGRLAKSVVLPGVLVGVAACSLVFGLNPSESSTPAADLSLPAEHGQRVAMAVQLPQETAKEQIQSPTAELASSQQLIDSQNAEGDRYRVKLALDVSESDEELEQSASANRIIELDVNRGDTLSQLFAKVNLGASVVFRITNAGSAGKALTRVFPGERLIFEISDTGSLESLRRIIDPLNEVLFTASNDSFVTEALSREPEVRVVRRSAPVSSSLSQAAYKAGISSGMTMTMANIFGGVMDFALDVRPNDSFLVIYEELYLDGEKISDGNILAAQYVNAGKTFNAFRYESSDGEIGYYNEQGESMRKVFLRAPLDFTRVSSGFNLRRLHPITKQVKPHRGIDYAAPTGTPIFSVGDGRVSASGYSKANGNFVFIRHGDTYQTKYLHLKKRNVKKGQRVKQGQIIGSVGCTGLCTGPHLHYEFLVNGVHRNPRTIVSKLPKAKRLAKSEIANFESVTLPMQEQIRHYGEQTLFALGE